MESLKNRHPVQADKQSFFVQPTWKKSFIVLAGIVINFILGWLLVSIVLMVGTPKALVIAGTEPGSPAAAAHIAAGDVVKNFTDAQSFISYVDAHRGQSMQIALLRNGKEVDVTVTPRTSAGPNQGPGWCFAIRRWYYPRTVFPSAVGWAANFIHSLPE